MQLSVRIIGSLIAAAVFLNGCANVGKLSEGGVEMTQVPVTENPTGTTFPGKFIWHDLLTPDPLASGKFYEKLFGWQIDYQGKYAVVRNDGKLIAGILKVEPAEGREAEAVWMPTVSVADVNAAASRVTANGGMVLKGPLDMDKRGQAVLISDPQRADLVLLEARGGDPADSDAAIGDWLWDEIWTDDPDGTEAFYEAVLGYDETVLGEGFDIFLSNGKWRAGVRYVKDRRQHMLWVPVVRVAVAAAVVQGVLDMGGVFWVCREYARWYGDCGLF